MKEIKYGAHTKTKGFQALLLHWSEQDACLGLFDRAKAHLERRTEKVGFDEFLLGLVGKRARAGDLKTASMLAEAIESEAHRGVATQLIQAFDSALAKLAKDLLDAGQHDMARLVVAQMADEERKKRGLVWINGRAA